MELAAYKDLCIDAHDEARMERFWGAALGLAPHIDSDGDTHLSGPTPGHTVWVNRVPEPRTVKQRMHLDIEAGSVQEILDLGATVLDADSFRWTVLADPEGGELCVFVREGLAQPRLYEIVADTGDAADAPGRIARWWAEVLGASVVDDGRGFSYVEQIPGAPFESLSFVPVPEPKSVKNRIHLDVTAPHVAALVAFGATVLRDSDAGTPWTVLADPDGNEFCAFGPA